MPQLNENNRYKILEALDKADKHYSKGLSDDAVESTARTMLAKRGVPQRVLDIHEANRLGPRIISGQVLRDLLGPELFSRTRGMYLKGGYNDYLDSVTRAKILLKDIILTKQLEKLPQTVWHETGHFQLEGGSHSREMLDAAKRYITPEAEKFYTARGYPLSHLPHEFGADQYAMKGMNVPFFEKAIKDAKGMIHKVKIPASKDIWKLMDLYKLGAKALTPMLLEQLAVEAAGFAGGYGGTKAMEWGQNQFGVGDQYQGVADNEAQNLTNMQRGLAILKGGR